MPDTTPTVLIVTTGHHPDDGRLARHVEVLRSHGFEANVIALEAGSRRARFLRALPFVVRSLRRHRPTAAIFVDPELFGAGPVLARLFRVRSVLDIHEDYPAVAAARDWIPKGLRGVVGHLVRWYQALGRRLAHATVVAADHLARGADRVVTNLPAVADEPPTTVDADRLVYVGDVSNHRGAEEMVALLGSLPGSRLIAIGPVGEEMRRRLGALATSVGAAGRLELTGRLPYEESWQIARSACAGLSLLRPTRAYRDAIPSKLYDYLAHGIPVVVSDLPAQAEFVTSNDCGAVVADLAEAAAVITLWRSNGAERDRLSRNGRAAYERLVASDGSAPSLVAAVSGDGLPTPT